MSLLTLAGAAVFALGLLIIGLVIVSYRTVVAPNQVHFVTSGKTVYIYGQLPGESSGSVYYAWPKWIPKFGVVVAKLPLTVFSQNLSGYEAYDVGRLPFVLDIKAFFRINDPKTAAQRISSFEELLDQLESILQGSVRTILASEDIENIMQGRSQFGEKFTTEVNEQLKSWGVTTVKMIELMDIRDSENSKVIANIMDKKKSLIERESRVVVAENKRAANEAEIEAARAVEVRKQEAAQSVGIRTAEAEREVGNAKERSQQSVLEQATITAEKKAAVKRVDTVRAAEIAKDKAIVDAEGKARETIILAEGELKQTQLQAEGVRVEGVAKADAEKAMQLAPVQAQIELAKEIGSNLGYQEYLVRLEQVKAGKDVGIANASALSEADVKVIVTGGSAQEGLSSVSQLISPRGGQAIGAMLEGLVNTPLGKAIADKLLDEKKEAAATTGEADPLDLDPTPEQKPPHLRGERRERARN